MLGQMRMLKDLSVDSGKVLGAQLGLTDRRCILFGLGGLTEPLLRVLLLCGARVVASRRSPDKLAMSEKEYSQYAWSKEHFATLAADVKSQEQINEVCELSRHMFGGADLAVFCPGSIVKGANVAHGQCPTEVTDSAILEQVDADCIGGIRVARAIKPLFLEAHKQGIRTKLVNIDSIGPGRPGGPPQSASTGYNIAKTGLRMFSLQLAWQWAEFCSVNTVAPGPVLTDLNRERMSPEAPRGKTALSHTPTGEYIKFDDSAGAFIYLLSDLGSGVIGQTILVDNGITICPPY